jgi:hypothetical protein
MLELDLELLDFLVYIQKFTPMTSHKCKFLVLLADNESTLELILGYHEIWYAFYACMIRPSSNRVTLFLNFRWALQRQAK